MRKILSIVLTMTLMLSVMGAIPALAAVSTDGVIFSFDGNTTSVNGWSAADTGYGTVTAGQAGDAGKQATDVYALAEIGSANNEFRWNVGNSVWDTSDRQSYSYLVLTAQIKPTSSITDFRWCRNQGGQTAQSLSVTNNDTTKIKNNWNVGKWNTITTVYAFGNDYTTTTASRVAKTYVNGVLVDTITNAASLETDNDRLQMHVFGPAGTTFGIDNVKYYMTTTEYVPTAPALAAGTGYTVSGSAISINPDDATVVSALTASAGTSVRVYENNTFAKELTSTDVIPHGAVVVAEMGDSIAYYDVTKAVVSSDVIANIGTTFDNSGLAFSDTTLGSASWSTTAIGAKTDTYANVTLGDGGEARMQKNSWTRDNSCTYLVLSAQIMPKSDSGLTKFFWGTNGSNPISGTANTVTLIPGKLNVGKWNTVVAVHNLDTKAADVYVNGVKAHDTVTAPGSPLDQRLQLHIFGTEGKTVGLDNIHIYQTNTYPEVTMPALAAGTNYTIEGNALKVHKDTTVAVDELTGSKVWNSAITSQLTSGNLVAGNVVTVESGDKISYYTVEENYVPGIYEVAKFNTSGDDDFEKITEAASGEWVSGIGGKAAADSSYKFTLAPNGTAGATGFIMANTNWLRTNKKAASNYLVFEMNLYPTASVNNFSLRTNTNDGITHLAESSETHVCYEILSVKKWNKLVTVLNIETGNTKTYLNGNLINDSGVSASKFGIEDAYTRTSDSGATTYEDATQVRLSFTSPVNPDNGVDQIIYIDDVRIYESASNVVPEVPVKFTQSGFSGNYFIDNDAQTMIIPTGTTVDDVASALTLADCTISAVTTGVTTATESTLLAKNSQIIIENENKQYTYYTVERVLSDYDIVFNGAAYDREYEQITAGKLSAAIYKPDEKEVKVLFAQYNKDDTLSDIDIIPVSGSGLVITAETDIGAVADSYVKTYVFDSMSTLVPLTVPARVDYETEALKILCIGSSYGVDGTRYVQQIAKSAGKKVVIANLYYGGCSLSQHDSFSSNNTANYTYYKNVNGTWTEQPSQTMLYGLKDEDWDIITIQQGAGDAGVADEYDPHLANVIAYVNNNKTNADAKLYWHLTWSFRDGSTKLSQMGKDSSEALYDAIIAAYESKVKSLVEDGTISGVIPAGTAVQNARQNSALYSWDGSTLTDVISRDDTSHLSYQYGRYLAGLVWAKTLAGVEVDASTWTPANLGYEVTEANLELIRQAAKDAITTPFAITMK